MDTTAAGDLWDNGSLIPAANAPTDSGAGNNIVVYALPTVIDGVAASVSMLQWKKHEGLNCLWFNLHRC